MKVKGYNPYIFLSVDQFLTTVLRALRLICWQRASFATPWPLIMMLEASPSWEKGGRDWFLPFKSKVNRPFTALYLVAKPLIWSQAEVDHVVIETNI